MKHTFQKSAVRAVRSTVTRFASIVVISFLGAGVFAGLTAVSPNMAQIGDDYYDEQNIMDIRMLSTYGFTHDDIQAIGGTDGVSAVMAGYTIDCTGSTDDADYTFRINGLPDNTSADNDGYINRLKLIDGRRPENEGEAIIIRPSIGLKGIHLGSRIGLDSASNAMLSDTLNQTGYTIAGIAESPYYLSFVQGSTTVGNGMIDFVLYIPQSHFIADEYTDVHLSVAGAKALDTFEDEYFETTGAVKTRLEDLSAQRQGLRRNKLEADLVAAKSELAAAEQALKESETAIREAATGGAAASGYAVGDGGGEQAQAEMLQKFESEKAEVESGLDAARREIAAGEQRLVGLGEPKWYVLDRKMNESYMAYDSDISRMHELATVFPVVFFLVAALVCLTTMTRMVDEDRTLIGTFKALGYSGRKITGRYLAYAAGASFIGSILGVVVGFRLFPAIIWKAYGIIFSLPPLVPRFHWDIALLAAVTTIFVTTLSTGIAAKNSLRESPANLMRPKAPKSGKRVFLERIRSVWSRLSFTQKVTVRNLGLNGKRLIMTLAGIIGCTALVLTALGAKSAVGAIVDDQFKDIFLFDVAVGLNGGEAPDGLIPALEDKSCFDRYALTAYSAASAAGNYSEADSIYIVSPRETAGFGDFVTLQKPGKGKIFTMADDSVIITEKLAINLHADIGDIIRISPLNESTEHLAAVTGITTNYTFNYVYIGPAAYQKVFGAPPEYNRFFAVSADGVSKDTIKEHLGAAGTVSFMEDQMGNIRTSVKSVDSIIWTLIIVASMLAFVVLYNLTNINIGERQRELAALKVLGFFDREAYSYIFRETVITSAAGSVIGLFAGTFLYRAVAATIEPDMIFVSRQLSWPGYLAAALLTMLFTLIVNQCMKPQIKRVDMLESMKSVD